MKRISYQRFFDEMVGKSSSSHRNFLFNSEYAFFQESVPNETEYTCIGEKKWKMEKKTNYVRLFYPTSKLQDERSLGIDKAKLLHQHVPLWISHLQKSIRRSEKHKAFCSTLSLLACDPVSLFRRLPIIMLEDTCIDRSFITLIWYMLATPIWMPNKEETTILLGIVNLMCELPFKVERAINKYDEDKSSNQTLDAIKSLQIRMAYGGMSSDMTMISETINYINRQTFMTDNFEIDSILIKPQTVDCPYLQRKEFIGAAIDFHVFPSIVKSIFKEKSFLAEKKIKDAIWNESSSVNVRKKKKKEEEQMGIGVWKIIKGIYIKKANYLLDKIISEEKKISHLSNIDVTE